MTKRRSGPGLIKAKQQRLVTERSVRLWHCSDYRWRELFEAADVMSEGACRDEPGGAVYYGTTSVLLPTESNGGLIQDDAADEVARLLTADPHARLRAIRIACREAQVRSRALMGRVRAELVVRRDSKGLRVDIDVEAPVFEDSEMPRATTGRSSAKPRN